MTATAADDHEPEERAWRRRSAASQYCNQFSNAPGDQPPQSFLSPKIQGSIPRVPLLTRGFTPHPTPQSLLVEPRVEHLS